MNPRARHVLLFVLAAATWTAALAQNEFVVNSTLDSTQRDPHVVRDGAGNALIVWQSVNQVSPTSQGDIVGRLFDPAGNPVGSEVLLNQNSAGSQERPAAAMNSSGNAIVAWASFEDSASIYDIKARRWAHGNPAGNEFLVNTTTAYTQSRPAAAITEDGAFLIAWDSWFQDGSDRGIFAQRFDSTGTPVGSEFQMNSTTAYSQMRPAVRFLPGGDIVAVWQSWNQDGGSPNGYAIIGRIFHADGSPRTDEFPVNTFVNDYQWFADLDVLDNGDFVVVWCSWEQDGDDGGIYGQRFNTEGVKQGDEFRVNSTSVNYQWLPKVRSLQGGGFAVAWSSWKQDGSREGVYTVLLDSTGRRTSFETQVNTTTHSFQWEPDLVAMPSGDLLVVWSSWGQTGHDYDVVGRRVQPTVPQGILARSSVAHPAGRTTSRVTIHVVDSTLLTGHSYRMGFDSTAGGMAGRLLDLTTGDTLFYPLPLVDQEGFSFRTPVLDGFSFEITPTFQLALDPGRSRFANASGTNLLVTVGGPIAGAKLLAPIDAALIWGSTERHPDGSYSAPLDTALGMSGIREVIVPFRAWNTTDNQKIDLLVLEGQSTTNQRFDVGEPIILLTPVPYRLVSTNTFAQISTALPVGDPILPSTGDTNFVMTSRPLTSQDIFEFTSAPTSIVSVAERKIAPYSFELRQNYPNPFNPSTTIAFSVPSDGIVRLTVYNVLGQRVATLLDGPVRAGNHRVRWNAGGQSSGLYFSVLQIDHRVLARKMLLIK